MTIFISHITEEKLLADLLKDWLETSFAGRFDVFSSSNSIDLPAGANWLKLIEEKLSDSKILLVLCSPQSLARPWINFEAGAGWIKKLPIIPICHSGQTKQKLPTPLSFFQGLNVENPTFISELINSLANHLKVSRIPRVDTKLMISELKKVLEEGIDIKPLIPNEEIKSKSKSPEIKLENSDSFSHEEISSKFIITTNIDENNDPVDSNNRVLKGTKYKFLTKWFSLNVNQEYKYRIKILDSQKQTNYDGGFNFIAKSSTYSTWTDITIAKFENHGTWKVEIFLDNIKQKEFSFTVENNLYNRV